MMNELNHNSLPLSTLLDIIFLEVMFWISSKGLFPIQSGCNSWLFLQYRSLIDTNNGRNII